MRATGARSIRPRTAAHSSLRPRTAAEHFQWLTEDQSRRHASRSRPWPTKMADVLLYLVQLSGGHRPHGRGPGQLLLNAQKYPVDLARGRKRTLQVRRAVSFRYTGRFVITARSTPHPLPPHGLHDAARHAGDGGTMITTMTTRPPEHAQVAISATLVISSPPRRMDETQLGGWVSDVSRRSPCTAIPSSPSKHRRSKPPCAPRGPDRHWHWRRHLAGAQPGTLIAGRLGRALKWWSRRAIWHAPRGGEPI